MSALVPGANSVADCVTAGWPVWLVRSVVDLFDDNASMDGQDDELSEAVAWAFRLAERIQVPVDYDKARCMFISRALDRVSSEQPELIAEAMKLLARKGEGEYVHGKWDTLYARASKIGRRDLADDFVAISAGRAVESAMTIMSGYLRSGCRG